MHTARTPIRSNRARRAPTPQGPREGSSTWLLLVLLLFVIGTNLLILFASEPEQAGGVLCGFNVLLMTVGMAFRGSREITIFVVAALAGFIIGIGLMTGTLDFNLASAP